MATLTPRPAFVATVYPTETITVTVRDRSLEAPWGSGMTNPKTRQITIAAHCPCGARRGEPRGQNACDDGAYYWVQYWFNPCEHVDYYELVLAEADQLAALPDAPTVLARTPADTYADRDPQWVEGHKAALRALYADLARVPVSAQKHLTHAKTYIRDHIGDDTMNQRHADARTQVTK